MAYDGSAYRPWLTTSRESVINRTVETHVKTMWKIIWSVYPAVAFDKRYTNRHTFCHFPPLFSFAGPNALSPNFPRYFRITRCIFSANRGELIDGFTDLSCNTAFFERKIGISRRVDVRTLNSRSHLCGSKWKKRINATGRTNIDISELIDRVSIFIVKVNLVG